jgi:hypothetical protein
MIAWKWMCRKGECRPSGSYPDYCEAWQKSFHLRRQGIVEASLELPAIRKFLRPNDISEAELSAIVSSGWFHERVFDFFMLDDEAEPDRLDVRSSSVQ